jgi:hypothetical protein
MPPSGDASVPGPCQGWCHLIAPLPRLAVLRHACPWWARTQRLSPVDSGSRGWGPAAAGTPHPCPASSVRPAAWRRVVRDPPGRGAASQRARSMASPLGPSPRSLRGHPSPHVDVCSAGVSCKPGSTWGRQASMLACWTSPGPGGMSGCACPHGSHRLTQATRTWAAPRGRRSPSPTRRGSPHERAGLRVSMRPARGRLSRLREWIVSYSDGRVRHIMFHFPPSPVIGAVILLSAGTGQTQCGQVVCRTSPHAPGTRPLAGEAVGGGQRAAS